MRWRFRSATEPPKWQQRVLSLAIPPEDRAVLLSDLQDEYEELVAAEGTASARRAYREQVLGSLGPAIRWRWHRVLYPRHGGITVPVRWRPEPRIPTDETNRGDNMADLWSDLKTGFRGLVKKPLMLVAIVMSLTIGIAATATVFSISNAFLLRPPAVDLPSDVVAIFTGEDDGEPHGDTSYLDYLDIRADAAAIDRAFVHRVGALELEDEGGRRRLLAELVAGDYFELMSLDFTLGRGFTADQTPVGAAERLVVLSHDLWSRRYGSDPEILGRTLRFDGHPYTIVGVGPADYLSRFLGLRIDAWVPMGVPGGVYHATPSALEDRGDRQYRMMARLAPGAHLAQVASQLSLVAAGLITEFPEEWSDDHGQPRALTVLTEEEARLPREMRFALSGIFGALLVATGILLLIACSNVACLFLARAHQRRREMAVRLALGAGRARLVRMLMIESLLPALLAGVLGSALAAWAAGALSSMPLPFGVPLHFDFQLDARVLLFTLLVSVAASVFFGLLPALESAAPNLVTSLKADVGTGDRRPRRFGLRKVLVVGQVAASLAFVVAAGLTLRAVGEAAAIDTGFDIERRAVMSRNLPEDRIGPEAAGPFLENVVERLRRRPDIEDAHVAISAEMSWLAGVHRAEIKADGYRRGVDESTFFSYNSVTPGYLETMNVTLLRGRLLDTADRPGSLPVAVVNKAFVERFWPGRDGLDERFEIARLDGEFSHDSGKGTLTVVGVACDGHFSSLTRTDEPFFWTSLPQRGWSRRVLLHVRGRASSAEALRALKEEVELVPGESNLILPTAYQELVATELFMPRMLARLASWGGLFGGVLAIFGIYSIVSFTATLRNREMAIRQALGAHPEQVVRVVVQAGLKLALWGVVVGLALVVPVAALLRHQLFGVSPLDPLAVGGSAALMLAAAALASWLPATRLTTFDPMGVLRDD